MKNYLKYNIFVSSTLVFFLTADGIPTLDINSDFYFKRHKTEYIQVHRLNPYY